MARRVYRSIAQLEAHYKKAMHDTIMNDVFPVMRNILLEYQYDVVYDSYDPVNYIRRGTMRGSGGLGDPDNTKIYEYGEDGRNGTIYHIVNFARVNGWDGYRSGTRLDPLIQGKDGFAGDPMFGMPPRPYTWLAYTDIVGQSKDAIRMEFETGMAKRGFKVKAT